MTVRQRGGAAMYLTAQGLGSRVAFAVLLVFAPLLAVGATTAPAAPGNGASGNAAISADGRFVAFASDASDLVVGDTNNVSDVFVRDRARGTTERVSVGPAGIQSNARTGLSAISADGRFVVMWSDASNLVPNDTNGVPDVFVHDSVARTTERVSVGSGGVQADGESVQGAISAGARIVAFASTSSNLPGGGTTPGFNVYAHDRVTHSTELIGDGWTPALSADGRYIAFAARSGRILVIDRALGATEDVSVATDGAPLPGTGSVPSISADGRFVAFLMVEQTTPRDRRTLLYVRDRSRRTTVHVVDNAGNPSISADGRVVAFSAGGVFVRDLLAGTTGLASASGAGVPGNGDSYTGSGPLSADGRFVSFFSLASNLDQSDTNGTYDVFVRDRRTGTTELVSVARSRLLVAERLTMLPKRPVPGKLFTVTLRVRSEDGPVPDATVRCVARVGGRTLPVAAATFRSSSAQCVWQPRIRRHHARLIGSISVTTAYASVKRTFATRMR